MPVFRSEQRLMLAAAIAVAPAPRDVCRELIKRSGWKTEEFIADQHTVLGSDTPFEKQRCAELTFEFTQPGN